MGKESTLILDWVLYVYDENYYLAGTCENHPIFGKNSYIRETSSLVNYKFQDDVLTFETLNTIYIAPIKYMDIKPYNRKRLSTIIDDVHRTEIFQSSLDEIISASAKMTIEYLNKNPGYREKEIHEADFPEFKADYSADDFLNYIKSLQEIGQKELREKQEAEENRLIEIAKKYEDCIYLEVSNIEAGDVLAFHIGDNTGVIYPYVNVGTFQDSVLYTPESCEYSETVIDFRYWPRPHMIETYSWSDNIKQAVIKNEYKKDILFNDQTISPGETKIFTEETHNEGLISPDMFNGKCFLNPKVDN